jgi:hypothetical protein
MALHEALDRAFALLASGKQLFCREDWHRSRSDLMASVCLPPLSPGVVCVPLHARSQQG